MIGEKVGGGILEKIGKLASIFVQDATKKLELTAEIQKLTAQAAEKTGQQHAHEESMAQIALLQEQIKANEAQAASVQGKNNLISFFIAGARPAAMWVGVFALGYDAILYNLICWSNNVFKWGAEPPSVDTNITLTILCGLLGLQATRTYEKHKRVATSDFRSHPEDAPKALPVDQSPK